MAKSKEEIEKEIIRFLDENSTHKGDGTQPGCGLRHGIACALGTSKNNIPRVTPIDFFNDGLTLWMIGNAGGKLGNIRSNPNVSVGIYTRMDHSVENRSIQLWGKASLITYRKQKELFMEIITERFPILDAIRQDMQGRRDSTYHTPRMIDSAQDEDFGTELEKGLNSVALIKVEPERIALLISRPDGTMEKLIWEKSR